MDVLPELVALGLAVAASPFPVVPALLLLFTARPRAAGSAFLGGWALGVGGVAVVTTAAASALDRFEEPAEWAAWVRIGLGLALVVLGWWEWRTRAAHSDPPGWMSAIDGYAPRQALRLGVLLSAANPKILVLAGAAGVTVGSADLDRAGTLAALGVFLVIACLTVASPVVLSVVLGDRLLSPAGRARDWLLEHSAAVMAVVVLVIGVLLIAKGASGI